MYEGGFGGRYRIVRQCGAGAHAKVYEAEHEFLQVRVALKVQRPNAPAGSIAKEARMLALLRHSAFVQVLDGGEHAEGDTRIPFLVEELLRGLTIRQLLVDGPISVDRVLEIGRVVTEAARVAHASGIVIRDIKPENVMITEDGAVKMIDLGLACKMGEQADDEGTISGTWCYLPPEAIATGRVGPQLDQYAIATTLYEMIAGRHPRADGNGALPKKAETLRRSRYSVAPPTVDGAPIKLMNVLSKALSPEPSRRFLDLADFGAALKEAG